MKCHLNCFTETSSYLLLLLHSSCDFLFINLINFTMILKENKSIYFIYLIPVVLKLKKILIAPVTIILLFHNSNYRLICILSIYLFIKIITQKSFNQKQH